MKAIPATDIPGLFGPPPTTDASVAGYAEELNTMDETLDQKILKERQASFLKAIKENHGIIHKTCRSWTRSREDQEDLYQEIVFQLWKSYSSFNASSKLSTWIYGVAVRSAIQPFRRRKVMTELPDIFPEVPSDETPDGPGIDDQLFRIFHSYEKNDRAVLVLAMEGFAAKEIGVILGMRTNAVEQRLGRIKRGIEWQHKIKQSQL